MLSPTGVSVAITRSHVVRCTTDSSWQTLPSPFQLGPLDQLVGPTIPVAVVFIYDKSEEESELIPVPRLHRAFSRLLDYYPHLTGRLQIAATDGTPSLTLLGTGAELFEARCSETLAAFSPPGPSAPGRILYLPDAGNALLPPFEGTLEAVCSGPLVSLQHTRFACGSVALGVRVLHKLTDAEGFFQLVGDLAELYRAIRASELNGGAEVVPTLSQPPHIPPYMSDVNRASVSSDELRAALEYKPSLFYVDSRAADAGAELSEGAKTSPSFTAAPSMSTGPPPPTVGRFIRFSSSELRAIKAHATPPRSSASSPGWVSTFEALSAHIFQHVHRARLRAFADTPLSPTDFLSPVNVRSRSLGLPLRYFGNALLCSYTTIPAEHLADGPLWEVARALHDMTRTLALTDANEVAHTLRWIALQEDKTQIRQGFRYGNGSLMLSQWNRFAGAMYGALFDGEREPALVSPPFTAVSLVDGLGYFQPCEDRGEGADEGAIDVNLALSDPVWDVLEHDEGFRRFRDGGEAL